MQRRAIAEHGKEAGGSAVSFVMVLPILITLMCAIVDLGRLAFIGTELESATQTVCRRMADQVSLSGVALPSSCDITEALSDASPSLSSLGVRCSATCRVSDTPDISYQRHRFDAETGLFIDENASMRAAKIEVSSTLEGDYLTPVGQILSAGGGATFGLSAQATRTVLKSQEVVYGEG